MESFDETADVSLDEIEPKQRGRKNSLFIGYCSVLIKKKNRTISNGIINDKMFVRRKFSIY